MAPKYCLIMAALLVCSILQEIRGGTIVKSDLFRNRPKVKIKDDQKEFFSNPSGEGSWGKIDGGGILVDGSTWGFISNPPSRNQEQHREGLEENPNQSLHGRNQKSSSKEIQHTLERDIHRLLEKEDWGDDHEFKNVLEKKGNMNFLKLISNLSKTRRVDAQNIMNRAKLIFGYDDDLSSLDDDILLIRHRSKDNSSHPVRTSWQEEEDVNGFASLLDLRAGRSSTTPPPLPNRNNVVTGWPTPSVEPAQPLEMTLTTSYLVAGQEITGNEMSSQEMASQEIFDQGMSSRELSTRQIPESSLIDQSERPEPLDAQSFETAVVMTARGEGSDEVDTVTSTQSMNVDKSLRSNDLVDATISYTTKTESPEPIEMESVTTIQPASEDRSLRTEFDGLEEPTTSQPFSLDQSARTESGVISFERRETLPSIESNVIDLLEESGTEPAMSVFDLLDGEDSHGQAADDEENVQHTVQIIFKPVTSPSGFVSSTPYLSEDSEEKKNLPEYKNSVDMSEKESTIVTTELATTIEIFFSKPTTTTTTATTTSTTTAATTATTWSARPATTTRSGQRRPTSPPTEMTTGARSTHPDSEMVMRMMRGDFELERYGGAERHKCVYILRGKPIIGSCP